MADDVVLPGTSAIVATDDIGSGRQVQLVKPVFGADGTATMVSADAGLPVAGGYAVLSGSASANNTDLISAAANGFQLATLTLTGTYSATVQVQGSNDNSNWFQLSAQNLSFGGVNAPTGSNHTNSASPYVVPLFTRYVRVRTTSYTSGTVSAILYLHNGGFSGLTAGSLQLANTNISANDNSSVAAFGIGGYNGLAFDRWRNNFNTTTGDTGAKTTDFLGATQTNYNSPGAYITLRVGATSGTFTTFQTGLQFSPDGGTTWLPFTPAGANLTTPASGNSIVWHVYPDTGSVTPAASGGVAAATQYNYVPAALPRTWRFAMSIAGTSPSLTVTAVNVNYIV